MADNWTTHTTNNAAEWSTASLDEVKQAQAAIEALGHGSPALSLPAPVFVSAHLPFDGVDSKTKKRGPIHLMSIEGKLVVSPELWKRLKEAKRG